MVINKYRELYFKDISIVYHQPLSFLIFSKMSLLILADSQVDRIWRNVRQNRELLRTAEYFPVKRVDQLAEGFKAMKASVSFSLTNMWGPVGDLF